MDSRESSTALGIDEPECVYLLAICARKCIWCQFLVIQRASGIDVSVTVSVSIAVYVSILVSVSSIQCLALNI